MVISNYVEKEKLKYDDICDLILVEDVRRKDSDELFGLDSALNVDNRDRGNKMDDKGSNMGISKSRNKCKSKSYSRQVVCWNFQKLGHFKKDCRN